MSIHFREKLMSVSVKKLFSLYEKQGKGQQIRVPLLPDDSAVGQDNLNIEFG